MANPAANVISERRLLKRWFHFFKFLFWWSGAGKQGEKFQDTCKHPRPIPETTIPSLQDKGAPHLPRFLEKERAKAWAKMNPRVWIWLPEDSGRMAGVTLKLHDPRLPSEWRNCKAYMRQAAQGRDTLITYLICCHYLHDITYVTVVFWITLDSEYPNLFSLMSWSEFFSWHLFHFLTSCRPHFLDCCWCFCCLPNSQMYRSFF